MAELIGQLKVAAKVPLGVKVAPVHKVVAPAWTVTVPVGLPSPVAPVTVPDKVTPVSEP